MLTPLYLSHEDRDADAMTRLIAPAVLPADGSRAGRPPRCFRSSGTSATPRPARRRPRCCRSSPTGPARATRAPSSARSTGATSRTAAGAAASCRSPTSARTPARTTRVVFPLFWHFAERALLDDGPVPALLPAPGPARLRRPPSRRSSTWATTPARATPSCSRCCFASPSERNGRPAPPSRRSASPSTIATAPASPSGRSSPSSTGAAATIARTSRWCRCSGTSPIARPTEVDDGLRPSTGTAAGAARRPTALFPLFYYRRGARPGGDDETSLTLFPLFHYRRDADTHLFVSLLGASVHGAARHAAASSAPTSGSRTRTSTPASSRCSTPTSCAAPTDST